MGELSCVRNAAGGDSEEKQNQQDGEADYARSAARL
jgi:hypothetical protein